MHDHRAPDRSICLALLLLSGCTSSSIDAPPTAPPPSPVPPGLTIVAIPLADTVDAIVTAPLVVSVGSAAGAPLAGVDVVFDVLHDAPGPAIDIAAGLNGSYVGSMTNRTGTDGKVSAYFRNTTLAATGRVRIGVTALTLADTVDVQSLPGAPARLDPGPADTAVTIGGTFTSPARVLDRHDNVRPLHPIMLVIKAPLPATSTGLTITGTGFGRGEYTVSAPPFAVAESLSVVPSGVLAGASNRGIETFQTDGSDLKSILTARSGDWISWSPDGAQIVFGGGGESKTYVVDLQGAFRLAAPGHPGYQWAPQYSPNGEWIYFSTFDDPAFRVGRVLADGTGFEIVPGLESTEAYEPTVSAGGLLVYRGAAGLVQRNLTTGTSVPLGFDGHSPHWSPDGTLMAYLDGATRALWVVAADGSGRHAVTTTGGLQGEFVNSIDWSADNQWAVVKSAFDGSIFIVQISTGLLVRLPFAGAWGSLAWRPE